jgi:hypothetical protein
MRATPFFLPGQASRARKGKNSKGAEQCSVPEHLIPVAPSQQTAWHTDERFASEENVTDEGREERKIEGTQDFSNFPLKISEPLGGGEREREISIFLEPTRKSQHAEKISSKI